MLVLTVNAQVSLAEADPWLDNLLATVHSQGLQVCQMQESGPLLVIVVGLVDAPDSVPGQVALSDEQVREALHRLHAHLQEHSQDMQEPTAM